MPQGGVPGETLSPTQPFPTAAARRCIPRRSRPTTPSASRPGTARKCREPIAALRSEGIFTPPSLEGSIQYPGMVGGPNWGSVASTPSAACCS